MTWILFIKDYLIAMQRETAEAGLELDERFSLGAFAGLLTLLGEEYVGTEQAMKMLEAEVKRIMMLKSVAVAADGVAEFFGG